MFHLKKRTGRVLCALLTAAMLCSDTGLTAFAAGTAAQDILAENEDAVSEQKPDAEKTESDGGATTEESVSENDAGGEESVSENDVAAEENLLTAETAEGEPIASGKSGNITWTIDAEGNLTVTGTGDFDTSDERYGRIPWYKAGKSNSVKTVVVSVTGMTDASYLFYGCQNLTSVDFNGFDTGEVTDMSSMFLGCSNLTSLDMSGCDASHVTNAYGVFDKCEKLQKICAPCNLTADVELPGGTWYQTDGRQIEKLPQNLDHSIGIAKDEPPKEIPVESIALSEKLLLLKTGESKQLTVEVTPAGATVGTIAWKSSNDEIAKVEDGTVTAVSAGRCTVTASAGDKMASCEVTVVPGSTSDPTDPTDPTDKIVLTDINTTVTFTDTSGYVYDGTAKTPEVTVSCRIILSTVTLEKDKDYTVTYENNINAFEDSVSLLTAQNAPKAVITGINKYSGTVSKAFTIQKAAAPQGEERVVNVEDYQAGQPGCTLDLSGCFAECQKTGYMAGTPVEDDTISGSVIDGQPSVDEKGVLTCQTLAGTRGDFAVIPVTVSFRNHKDATVNVKIMLGNGPVENVLAPTANPESGRQLAAGATVTLTCGTAGAAVYYTTGTSEKDLAEPTEASTCYTAPIAIDRDMYIKAAAIKGGSRSKTVAFHYTVLTETGQAMMPYAIPGQGVVEKGTKVELRSDTPDAVIYYVAGKNPDMLGKVPDDDGHKYTTPIELNEDTAIKAVARKDGMEDSDAAILVYRLKSEETKIGAPEADPAPGKVDQGKYISLTADSDANIYYTTDGSEPAVSGTAKLYEEKIKVVGSAGSEIVLKAAAEKKGIYSQTVTFTYTVSENKVKGLQVTLAGREEYTYTGSAITPAVIVTNDGEELTEGEDYTLQYSSNVNAAEKDAGSKAPKVTVKGKGNLAKSKTVTFAIKPKNIGDEEEVVGAGIMVASGKTASPALFYGGKKLGKKDFENPDAKTTYSADGTITIMGKGNFTGKRTIAVKVVDKDDLKKFTVAVDKQALKNKPLVYDGEAKTLDGYLKVYDKQDKSKSNPLKEYTDYAVIYPKNNINAGRVSFTVVGLGEYYGAVTGSYTITPKAVKTAADGEMKVSLKDSYPFRSGGVTIPDLSVTCDDKVLIPFKDYKVTYSGNKKISTSNLAKCTISFLGNYKGSTKLVKNFRITRAELSDEDKNNGTMRVDMGDMVYTGKPGACKSVPYVTVNGALLKASDYTVSYYKDPERKQLIDSVNFAENDRRTAVYVKIEGKGNYNGTLTAQYNVYKREDGVIDLSKAKVTFTGGNKAEYTGEKVKPDIEIRYKAGGGWQTVPAADIGSDLTVIYINNVNKGNATVMVNGNGGKYVGSRTAKFKIQPKDMNKN